MRTPLGLYHFGVLLILDGWGEAAYSDNNAVKLAKTPHLDYLYRHSHHTLLQASGEAVGLPNGIIGNSEVGHLNIGAGRVVLQEVLRINSEIANKKFFSNSALKDGIEYAKANKKKIHIIGLCSDALVHSSLDHMYAILKMCADSNIHENVFIHAITDGRDTPIDSSYKYITDISEKIKIYNVGEIATVSGRYYAMDRDERWDRIELEYNALIAKENSTRYFTTAIDGIRQSLNEQMTDEFIKPFRVTIDEKNKLKGLAEEGDVIIFFNFRQDRTRQLTEAFVLEEFTEFQRTLVKPYFITLTEYAKGLTNHIAYNKEIIHSPISQVLSELDIPQFKIAETEKYAHLTYFFNGEREAEFSLEDRYLIPSLKIPTYDLKPQMRVFEITTELIEKIRLQQYRLLVANFANADMVGHTGNLQATIKACEYIDECVGDVIEAVFQKNGILFVSADHGNAEVKFDHQRNEIATAHTTNPVPFIATSRDTTDEVHISEGKLGDIAPTILARLGIDRSFDMSGFNLLA